MQTASNPPIDPLQVAHRPRSSGRWASGHGANPQIRPNPPKRIQKPVNPAIEYGMVNAIWQLRLDKEAGQGPRIDPSEPIGVPKAGFLKGMA